MVSQQVFPRDHLAQAIPPRACLTPREPRHPLESRPALAVAVGTKLVYDFSEGSREMRDLLGGKGAGVAEMTRLLGPERVPAGFTITTEACVAYMEAGR